MFGAGSSTERLHATSAVGSRGDAGLRGGKRRVRPMWFWIAAVVATVVIAGAVVGALVAKNVIKVGSNKSTAAASVPDGGTSSTATFSTSTATSRSSRATSASSSSSSSSASASSSTTSTPAPTTCPTSDDIPSAAKDTWTDTTSWLDLKDFNCTYTNETVGDLPIAGLNSTWDDSARANPSVPALNESWGAYTSRPVRGVNLGGWFSLEPFITPSLFDSNSSWLDEYTMCKSLGPKEAAITLETHYSTFMTEDDFKAIAAAGLDHVRIPFSYWAVKTYDNDPYVFGVSWRYLLRAIEWARKNGLRVNLDLHGVPGSQNGWNHSGKQGTIDWLSGPDGSVNAQRTLDIHNQLSKFFAQDRYKNVIAFYGLVNEPSQSLAQADLVTWTKEAYDIVHGNGVVAIQIFSEAFKGLPAWQGQLTGYGNSLVIDVHEYTIFSDGQIGLTHEDRISFACNGWTDQIEASLNTATGFGPTLVGEWSQADTDCAKYLNAVGNGARWDGTFSGEGQPSCPTKNDQCSCDIPNTADVSTLSSDYKQFLLTWAEAQMFAFEKSWGWFYWTWKTESAPLWSYQSGLEGNFLPAVAYERNWDCSQSLPSFGSLPEYY